MDPYGYPRSHGTPLNTYLIYTCNRPNVQYPYPASYCTHCNTARMYMYTVYRLPPWDAGYPSSDPGTVIRCVIFRAHFDPKMGCVKTSIKSGYLGSRFRCC